MATVEVRAETRYCLLLKRFQYDLSKVKSQDVKFNPKSIKVDKEWVNYCGVLEKSRYEFVMTKLFAVNCTSSKIFTVPHCKKDKTKGRITY